MEHTSNTPEQWRDVPGYEGIYQVSDRGNVWRMDRPVRRRYGEIILPGGQQKQTTHRFGYLYVTLTNGGKRKTRTVHSLVAEAFLAPRPEGMVVCHADGNKSHNSVWNLRYDTPSGNEADKVKHGTDHNLNKTHCKNGHLLEMPNLQPSRWKYGHRICLACGRARSRVRSNLHLRPYFQEVSDSYYAAILAL